MATSERGFIDELIAAVDNLKAAWRVVVAPLAQTVEKAVAWLAEKLAA